MTRFKVGAPLTGEQLQYIRSLEQQNKLLVELDKRLFQKSNLGTQKNRELRDKLFSNIVDEFATRILKGADMDFSDSYCDFEDCKFCLNKTCCLEDDYRANCKYRKATTSGTQYTDDLQFKRNLYEAAQEQLRAISMLLAGTEAEVMLVNGTTFKDYISEVGLSVTVGSPYTDDQDTYPAKNVKI